MFIPFETALVSERYFDIFLVIVQRGEKGKGSNDNKGPEI